MILMRGHLFKRLL